MTEKIERLGINLGEGDNWYCAEDYNFCYRNYKPSDILKERFLELQNLKDTNHDIKIIRDRRNRENSILLEIINTETKKIILTIQITMSALFERIQDNHK